MAFSWVSDGISSASAWLGFAFACVGASATAGALIFIFCLVGFVVGFVVPPFSGVVVPPFFGGG